jgi:hypothetical protein
MDSIDQYIDLQITNVEQVSSYNRTLSSFYHSSSQIILKDTSNYKLAIIRFILNTESLPVFIPQLQLSEKLKTVYSFTFEYNGQYYQQYMEYEPQILNSADSSEYYFVLSYQWFIYLINKCIISALDGLNKLIALPDEITFPKMEIDLLTKICSLNINNSNVGYNETNKINIYMNYQMYSLFVSLPSCIVNKNMNGMDIQINNLISADKTKLSQEFSTTGLWNPISSIVFTTNMIPIVSTNTPPIQIYKNGTSNSSASFNFLNIITDFIGNDLNFTQNSFLQYDSQNNRYIALKDNQELKNLDINVYWIHKISGILSPVYLAPNSFSSIKILLTKE